MAELAIPRVGDHVELGRFQGHSFVTDITRVLHFDTDRMAWKVSVSRNITPDEDPAEVQVELSPDRPILTRGGINQWRLHNGN